jgi:hypothetical protein
VAGGNDKEDELDLSFVSCVEDLVSIVLFGYLAFITFW